MKFILKFFKNKFLYLYLIFIFLLLFFIFKVIDSPLLASDDKNISVLCLGDSITHGYPYIGTNKTYPAKLQETLESTTNYYTYNVINHGVSGYRADQVLSALETQNWLNDDPDYVLLMVGGNDLAQEIQPDLANITAVINQTVSEVQSIINLVKNHQNADGSTPKIILSAFPPNNLSGGGGSLVVAAYNNRLQNDITNMDKWFTSNWDDLYNLNTHQAKLDLMSDSVHPNEEGYSIVADNWYEVLESYLLEDPTDNENNNSGNDNASNTDNSNNETNENNNQNNSENSEDLPVFDPKILATSGPGEETRMQAYDSHGNAIGSQIKDLFPANYKGGAGIVSIDAENNGLKDQLLIFALQNGGPQTRLFGLKESGQMIFKGQMFVFDKKIRDGLSVTSGDFDNDGYQDDIATCLTGNQSPTIRVYQDVKGVDHWKMIKEFTASFGKVGCNLGTFQYDGGAEEILVTPNHGSSEPRVYIYNVNGILKNTFFAYDRGLTSGISASGIDDRIYTTPNNGSSHVRVFDKHGNPKSFWWAYQKNIRGDFRNVAGDIDLDGKKEILISPIGANGPHILSFESTGKLRTWPNFFAFNKNIRNGVSIAVIDNFYGMN